MPIGTNGPRGKGMKWSTLRVKRSNVRVTQGGNRSQKCLRIDTVSQELSDEFSPNLPGIYYGKSPLYHNN